MQLPRWLVMSLLSMSLFAVLGAASWWWVTWVADTVQEYISKMRSGNLEGADAMVDPDCWLVKNQRQSGQIDDETRKQVAESWGYARLEGREPRELSDLALARATLEYRF